MATDTQILQTILRLRDEVSANAKKAAASIKEVANASDSSSKEVQKLSENMKETSKTALKVGTAITAGAAASLIGATKVGMGFEKSMSQVAATMGMTATEVQNGSKEYLMLSDAAKKAGKATKYSASQAGEALNYLALAGYDAKKATEALPTILSLAAAGEMELGYASDLVTDSMSALGLEMNQLNNFSDQMAKAAQKSNTNISQLGEAILTVGGTAKVLAGGTVELNTMLGILADNGIKGAEGGTALRNVILALTAPTDKAAGVIKKLGVDILDAQGNVRPLNEVLKDLDNALGGMANGEKTKVLNEIFNKVDLKSVNALLANSGERFDELSGYIKDCNGATKTMADTMQDNLSGKLTELGSVLEGIGISIYEKFETPLKNAVESITTILSSLPENVLAGAAGILVFGTILGTLMMAFGAAGLLITNFMTMVEPLGAFFASTLGTSILVAFGAILALVSAFTYAYSTSEEFRNKIKELGTSFMEFIKPIASFFMPILQVLKDRFKDILDAVAPLMLSFVNLGSTIMSVLGPVIAVVAGVLLAKLLVAFTVLASNIQTVMTTITGVLNGLATIIKGVIDLVVGIIVGDGEKISNSVDTIFSGVVKIVSSLWQGLIDIVSAPVQAIIDIADKQFGDKVKVVKDGWESLKNFIKHPIKAVADLVTKGNENKSQMPKFNLEDSVRGASDAVKNTFKAMSDSVVAEFEALKVKVGFKVEFMWTAIKGYFQAGINNIKAFVTETIPNIVDNIVNWFKELPFKIMEMLGRLVGDFILFGVALNTFATTQLPIIIESIVNWFRELPGKIKEFFSTVITNLITWGTEFYTNAQIVVVNAVNAIVTFFSEMPGKVATFFATIIADVITWGLNLYISAAEAVMNMINTVVTWMSTLPGKVQTKLTEVINKVTAWGINFVAKAKESAAKFKDATIEGLSKIPGKVVSIGKDIVGGICRGIENAVKGLSGFFQKMADSFMNGIKDKLGIHSPSRVAAKLIGRHIPTGIAVGFIKALPEAMRTINKGAQRLVQGVDIPLGVSAPIDMNLGKSNTYDPIQTNFSSGTSGNSKSKEKESRGTTVQFNISSLVIREEADFDKFANTFVKKLRLSDTGGVV